MSGRIVATKGILGGKPRVADTRISVELVLEDLANGWSVEELLREYPRLRKEDILACIEYAVKKISGERVYPVVNRQGDVVFA